MNKPCSAKIAVRDFMRGTDTIHETTVVVVWDKWLQWKATYVAAQGDFIEKLA